ncbi:hypothetical protein Plav_2216 [Parvibaculum lavamentivorans DS-1]|uniref:Uncharacterized protein n=1 Tax=Parvibaculum lavamentivorans (strain DS-1 / DSM 13023 / NCIMB 13966) TaxID=402881 RepID=A7HV97_PARL1|nr:hypothetical protein [Parvibaculum lavamentivorans]ABS63830.1 hypothetical protein Plav_2216 [Parvibaculum lavamentivorans DS-1]
MGILSRLGGKGKLEAPPAEETPPVTQAALQRALRATAQASGSLTAAELGQRIATALSTIETSVLAIDAVTERLREAAELVADARRNDDTGRRALLAGRYDDLRSEIDAIVGSASHNRINLISGRRIGGKLTTFDIALDDSQRSGIAIQVANLTTGEAGLALSPPREAFADDAEIDTIASEIEAARARAAAVSDRFMDHAALISDRLSRLRDIAGPRSMETHLPTGADSAEPPQAGEYELDMALVEDKLRALADRRKKDGDEN